MSEKTCGVTETGESETKKSDGPLTQESVTSPGTR
jgi:hypothetical protein